MTFKNTLFPILGILFVVSCSARPDNNNRAVTPPRTIFSHLPLPRAAYEALLDGEVLAETRRVSAFYSESIAATVGDLLGDNSRQYLSVGTGVGGTAEPNKAFAGSLATILPESATGTNDLVEKLYLTLNEEGAPIAAAKLSVSVGRGSFPLVAGGTISFAGTDLANDFTLLATAVIGSLTAVDNPPTIKQGSPDVNSPDFVIPEGFVYYTIPDTIFNSDPQITTLGYLNRFKSNTEIDASANTTQFPNGAGSWSQPFINVPIADQAFGTRSILLKIEDQRVQWIDVFSRSVTTGTGATAVTTTTFFTPNASPANPTGVRDFSLRVR